VTAEVDAYDPCTNKWTTVAPLPVATYAHAAVTGTDGRIYVLGGFGGSGTAAYAYDVATNAWSTLAPMSTVRGYFGAGVGPDGRIYAVGGQQNSGGCTVLASAEVYSPVSNTWAPVGPMSAARTTHAVVTGADGRIYAIGGEDCSCTAYGSVEVFDFATSSWGPGVAMPTAQSVTAATKGPDGRIYVIGGESGANGCQSGATSLVQIFDGTAWTTGANMPTARRSLAVATGPGSKGFVYAIGGLVSNAFSVVEAYDTANNAW
jgi:N-acetylneuraminic acid mutarotase